MALIPVCSGSFTGWRSATPGGGSLNGTSFRRGHRPLSVQGIPQRIEHATENGVTHGHAQQLPRAADFVTFVDVEIVAENDHADGVLFQVERQPVHSAGKLDHFTGHHAGKPIYAGNSVADFQHAADFADVNLRLVLLNFLLDY